MPVVRFPSSAIVALFALVACAGRPHVGLHEEGPVAHPLVAVATTGGEATEELPRASAAARTIGHCDRRGDTARLTIAHFNDLQARYSDLVAGHSRYAYIAGYLSALKEAEPNTLVLDAGDDYEKGAVAELRSMGETTRRMVQALPIDARTIGNHDFAYGAAAVMRDLAESAHPVLAANVTFDPDGGEGSVAWLDAPPPAFAPFVRIDVGCVRVGVVGLVTGNYASTDYPSRLPFDGVFRQDDHYERILTEVVRAHRSEVDVLIALDHLGLGVDMWLAGAVPGVDLVVGGHTEDLLPAPLGLRRHDGSHAYIVQAGHWAQTLGRADVVVDLVQHTLAIERYRIVNVDAALPLDGEVDQLARSLEQQEAPDARHAIAVVQNPVHQGKPMADLVWRAVRERWGADAMLLGKDVFWEGLTPGPVTLQRLFDTVLVQREPAGTSGFSSLFVVHLSGAKLLALRAKLIVGPQFAFYLPDSVDPTRTYRLVIEKRALENPGFAFRGGADVGNGRFAGELIDVLEAYARDRTAQGLPLDGVSAARL